MGHKPTKISTGQNCYRFLVPIETMQANPETNSLLEDIGPESLHVFRAADRSFVMYPCRSGTVMNIGAFVPSDENETLGDYSWLNAGNKEQLLSDFADFSPKIRALCRMAEDLKLWSLASRDPPRTFFKGKLALIGDAAHPFLPRKSQLQHIRRR
jgi:salicylate hydroxylase